MSSPVRRVLFALALAVAASPSAAATYEEGMAAYQRQDFAAAAEAFEGLAADGDARAQSALAILHARGEGAPKDLAKAQELFEAAAKQDYAPAQYHLGRMLMSDSDAQGGKDAAKAAEWFEKAAGQGHVLANYALALLHHSGEGVTQNLGRAAEYARTAAEAGFPDAQFMLGSQLYRGEGVEQDKGEGYYWIFLAAQAGMARAQSVLPQFLTEMPQEQIMEAERKASAFQPKQPKLGG